MELAIIALASMASLGFHFATDYLLIHFTGRGWDDWWEGFSFWQKTILKPLAACPPCMGSVHGTLWHFYLGGDLWMWPVTCLAVVFLNTLLNRWVE